MARMLTFLAWTREGVGDLVTGVEGGHAIAATPVTLTRFDATGEPTGSQTRQLSFRLAGPAEVRGLAPTAIRTRFPTPGTPDADIDRCPQVELADPGLPWRYTPRANPPADSGALAPWLTLVVGVDGDELTELGEQVRLDVALQQDHPLTPDGPVPWAHIQVATNGRRTTRLLATRPLEPDREYLAALVPTFRPDGSVAWTGSEPVTVPAYDRWRFTTGVPAGSFRALATRLQPGDAPATTGRAALTYSRLDPVPTVTVRGALGPIGPDDELAPDIRDDLDTLRTPLADTDGRPVIGLPTYGEAWLHDQQEGTTLPRWSRTLNDDVRHRVVAGLGAQLGVAIQEELVEELSAQLGDVGVAGQRLGDLVVGMTVGAGLWRRRLPQDPWRRVWALGPALGRAMTPEGSLADLACAPDRALPAGLFSTAARRVLRPGSTLTTALREPLDPRDVLAATNRCREPSGAPGDADELTGDGPGQLDARLQRVVETGEVDVGGLFGWLTGSGSPALHPKLTQPVNQTVTALTAAARRGDRAPYLEAAELLLTAASVPDPEKTGAGGDEPGTAEKQVAHLLAALGPLKERIGHDGEQPKELALLLGPLLAPETGPSPCRPVALDRLAQAVDDAFDPTLPTASARQRVLSSVHGVESDRVAAPVEACPRLDRPVWSDLAKVCPEWLLPGVGQLPQNTIIALATNAAFIDALLVGYNTQLLAEARWRNLPLRTGCTPLRRFWDRADRHGAPLDDILAIPAWPIASDLGDPPNRPEGAGSGDLVVVLRSELLQRYPHTVLSLVSAEHDGRVDHDRDPAPDALVQFPGFQGRIGTDVTFVGFAGLAASEVDRYWISFEEPPAGYHFRNLAASPPSTITATTDGAAFASEAFAAPLRVLVRGDALRPGGTP